MYHNVKIPLQYKLSIMTLELTFFFWKIVIFSLQYIYASDVESQCCGRNSKIVYTLTTLTLSILDADYNWMIYSTWVFFSLCCPGVLLLILLFSMPSNICAIHTLYHRSWSSDFFLFWRIRNCSHVMHQQHVSYNASTQHFHVMMWFSFYLHGNQVHFLQRN